MSIITNSNGSRALTLSPLEKRVLISKTVADTHQRLGKSGAFRRSFIATGTWLPDHKSCLNVRLQGLEINYRNICTLEAVNAHKRVVQAEMEKIEAHKVRLEQEGQAL